MYVPGKEDVCYIGSTIHELQFRLAYHNSPSCKVTSKKLYENGGKPIIELLELYPCNSVDELRLRERYWMEQFPNRVNKNIPGRTKEEYIKEWRDSHKDYIANYTQERKEIIKEQAKARYDNGYKERRNEAKREKAECDICKKVMNKNSIWTHKNTVHKTE
jgi:hypothetical protein